MNRSNNNNLSVELRDITQEDLNKILAINSDPTMEGYGRETVIYTKDSMVNVINSHLAEQRKKELEGEEKINSGLMWYNNLRKSKEAEDFRFRLSEK